MADLPAPHSVPDYDEFSFLRETAEEYEIPWRAPKVVRRLFKGADGKPLSGLVWGDSPAEYVFLHGGGQNAHTWDTVLLTLGRPAIAFDLLGHGRSSRSPNKDYSPWAQAQILAPIIESLPGRPRLMVGMSLGGATAIRLAAEWPTLAEKVAIVDVTPQVNDPSRQWSRAQLGTVALVRDEPFYPSLEAMTEAAVKLSPNRSPASTRRGVRHNARRLDDGRWTWLYDDLHSGPHPSSEFYRLWDDVSRISTPAMLVIGGLSSHVRSEDTSEMTRRLPNLRVETVAGAGHSIQSDRPLELTRLLLDFATTDRPA